MTEKSLVSQNQNPYQLMDRLDDNLIKAELENRIVDTWVYSFKSGGKVTSGLSKVGVDACCTEMAKNGHIIREGEVNYKRDPTDPDYMLFQGMAKRFILDHENHEIEMESVNGIKRQWTKMELKGGKIVPDPFWFEKGAMKALRNARARMIPEEIRTKIIALAKNKGKIKDIGEQDEAPKPQSSGYVTSKQLNFIFGLGEKQGMERNEIQELGRWYRKGERMTLKEASQLIENFDNIYSEYMAHVMNNTP